VPTNPNPFTNNINAANLFNPMSFWTDVSLSALDRTLSSTQNISDGVDRLTRAGAAASVETATPQAPAGRSATPGNAGLPADMGMELALRMQRSTFELVIQGWQQWMAALGTLASLGAGSTFRDTVERQNPWLKSMRESLSGQAQAGAARTVSAGSSRRPNGDAREGHGERDTMEHAAATTGARRPRGGRAGAKKKTRASGRSRREA
jgi:hypothetical protein